MLKLYTSVLETSQLLVARSVPCGLQHQMLGERSRVCEAGGWLFFIYSSRFLKPTPCAMSLQCRWSRVHCTGSRACEACRDPRVTKADPGVANRKRYHAAPKDLGENVRNVAQKSQEPVKERTRSESGFDRAKRKRKSFWSLCFFQQTS